MERLFLTANYDCDLNLKRPLANPLLKAVPSLSLISIDLPRRPNADSARRVRPFPITCKTVRFGTTTEKVQNWTPHQQRLTRTKTVRRTTCLPVTGPNNLLA